jgi:hypothetical protein
MAINLVRLKVFVASTQDLAEERSTLELCVREFNRDWSEKLGVELDLVRWETHAYPSIAADPQSVINEQIGDKYDIFVGLLGHRFGTPTPRAESGTSEEFERALTKYRSGEHVQIMFYFKDVPISPSLIDLDQLAKVGLFRSKLGEEGVLYWTFKEEEELVN